MDEPCSALDPISTSAIEDLIHELKSDYTIVIVTHNMQQAARVSEDTAFFNLAGAGKPGRLVEMNPTSKIFSNPDEERHRGLHLRPLRLSSPGRTGPVPSDRTTKSARLASYPPASPVSSVSGGRLGSQAAAATLWGRRDRAARAVDHGGGHEPPGRPAGAAGRAGSGQPEDQPADQ